MKLGVFAEANSGSLCISLGLYNSFSFGVVSNLLLRFCSPFKCTVERNFNAHNSLLKRAMQLKQAPFNFSFRLL